MYAKKSSAYVLEICESTQNKNECADFLVFEFLHMCADFLVLEFLLIREKASRLY